ncbi:substrate-binding periplasmic protein [Thalassospira marina]|uniref:Uncharacterized protein n=1 Tax=Thalassospira marina TaxID=2048283 RepID=A0A2N3KVJ7_9PROT|nr:transporter substrate-binding domain-containing protein [Thalassospira marina]PKR54599.1 hypothetical protein COO20_07520 [Thalassospira marina]
MHANNCTPNKGAYCPDTIQPRPKRDHVSFTLAVLFALTFLFPASGPVLAAPVELADAIVTEGDNNSAPNTGTPDTTSSDEHTAAAQSVESQSGTPKPSDTAPTNPAPMKDSQNGSADGAKAAPSASPNKPRKIELVTTEWPPYSGEDLTDFGLSSSTISATFAAADIETHITVLPWRRALQAFHTDPDIDGVFPVYKDRENIDDVLLSAPISFSPVGFVVYHNQLFDWKTLNDLQDMSIGVVAGYANTSAFDFMVATGKLRTVEANDDLTLLRLLRTGRVDVAVMDKLVMEYLLESYREFHQVIPSYRFHETALANKGLYIAFKNTAEGANLRQIFNYELGLSSCDNGHECVSR